MISFTLETQDLTMESRRGLIQEMYDKFLQDDDNWHFFYEMEMGDLIRVSEENAEVITNYLTEAEVKFSSNEWKETYPVVEANKEYFQAMFHMNSLLIVQNDDEAHKSIIKELVMIIDRFSHSLHNYLTLFNPEPDKTSPMSNEARTLAYASLNRATYDGIRYRYLQEKASRLVVKDTRDGTKDN